MKLTEKQRAALDHIKAGEVQKHRFDNSTWRTTGPSHANVVAKVIKLGLARWTPAPRTSDAMIASLTDLGREVLKA